MNLKSFELLNTILPLEISFLPFSWHTHGVTLWCIHMQIAWCSLVQIHAYMRRQATSENRDHKRKWNPNILWKRLDETYYTNRDISNLVHKPMARKCNSNLLPFCRGPPVDFICIACDETNSVPISNSYPLVTVTDQIPYTNDKSKRYSRTAHLPVQSFYRKQSCLMNSLTWWEIPVHWRMFIAYQVLSDSSFAYSLSCDLHSPHNLRRSVVRAGVHIPRVTWSFHATKGKAKLNGQSIRSEERLLTRENWIGREMKSVSEPKTLF